MTTVILDVRSLADSLSDVASTMASGAAESAPRISFATPELLWEVLTAERWALHKAIGGAGPISIGEVAARKGRDEAAVRGDLEALLRAGILDTAGEGCIEFPYDTVKVELLLRAA
ncbi:DNA-binding protein [Thioalkalicoccus limnaeus]|uniref:DNA-binding protein n=1 Tax=Thioalkalicoccus limnaeus TaxID=120681 RepID=A0ABV4BL87_9GAMM